jgi:hypothetical protein
MLSSVECHHSSSIHHEWSTPIAFAYDPVRSPALSSSDDLISPLNFFCRPVWWTSSSNKRWKNLYQKMSLSEHLCPGSTSAVWNNKIPNGKYLDIIRRKCLPYSSNWFHFLSDNCSNSHFFVIQVSFDGRTKAIFENVTVYDSMRVRSDNNKVKNDSAGGELNLLQFRKFLSLFCFFDCPRYDSLRNHPELILKMLCSPIVRYNKTLLIVPYLLWRSFSTWPMEFRLSKMSLRNKTSRTFDLDCIVT